MPPPATIKLQIEEFSADGTVLQNGKLSLSFSFVARNQQRVSVDASLIDVQVTIDEAEVEYVPVPDDEKIRPAMSMKLVLDASASMLERTASGSVPFDEMLQVASTSLVQMKDAWSSEYQGEFHYGVLWFNDWLYSALDMSVRGTNPEEVAAIPRPAMRNNATALFSAIDHTLTEIAREDLATGPRDTQALVILTDGNDNYSYFDSAPSDYHGAGARTRRCEQPCLCPDTAPTLPECPESSSPGVCGVPNSGLLFSTLGYQCTALPDVIESIRSQNQNLVVHAISLGELDTNAIREIAYEGNGNLFVGAPDNIKELFENAFKEFRSRKIYQLFDFPLGVGSNHKGELRVTVHSMELEGTCKFILDNTYGMVLFSDIECE